MISALVRGVCDHLGASADQTSSVELCAVEAVTNAIKHAYRGIPGNRITLEVCYTSERLDLSVLDQGLRMPPEQQEKFATGSHVFEFDPDDLNSLPEGGMGLEIIRQEMDQTSWSEEAAGNCLRMTKFLLPLASL